MLTLFSQMLEAKFIDEGDHFKINLVMGKPGVASKYLPSTYITIKLSTVVSRYYNHFGKFSRSVVLKASLIMEEEINKIMQSPRCQY